MSGQLYPDLKTFWYFDESDVHCCVCTKGFSEEALIRTFQLLPQGQERQHGTKILRTTDGLDLVLYDRHLPCLLNENVQYITVSHVWHEGVSDTQNQGYLGLQDPDVQRLVVHVPTEMARSISKALRKNVEVWHDYISVPQWSPSLKISILQSVHRIYASSTLTVVHLEDVTPMMVDKFLYASDDAARLDGMVGICNAQWYSRVWTAMEYIRSANVRVMDSELQLHGEESAQLYQKQLSGLWNEQVTKHGGDVHGLEARLEIGKNIMPWNLGPLGKCRADSKSRNFGLAFALLCRRGCRDKNDFLYALQGIITGNSVTELGGRDWDEMYLNLARQCLKEGDYTPLLMTPEFGPKDGLDVRNMPANNVSEGYNDVYAYSMGQMTSPPENHDALSFEDNGDVFIKMQKAGTVWKSEQWSGNYDQVAHFCAYNLATPSVEGFAEAFGSRLFYESKENMLEALSVGDRREKLEQTVLALSKVAPGQPWPPGSPYHIFDIIEALGITTCWPGRTQSRFDYQGTQGNVLHLTWRRYFVWVKCAACGARSVTDAGLFINNDQEKVHDAAMYRFPGLGYQGTNPGGICLLVDRKGKIVGRAIWATPACACEELETVRLQMPALPKPRPRSEFCEQLGWTS
ncbi:hypothetical protein EsH8_IV_000011 [Colletotrichum jinshuiense]